MPLEDGYATEKKIKTISDEIAEAITGHLEEIGENKTIGFVLFVVDLNTGVLQFTSDLPRETSTDMVSFWLKRESQ